MFARDEHSPLSDYSWSNFSRKSLSLRRAFKEHDVEPIYFKLGLVVVFLIGWLVWFQS